MEEPKIKFKLKPNQAIYIPEGWWHSVQAKTSNCISINYWLKGVQNQVKGIEKYLLKFCFKNLIEDKLNSYLKEYLSFCIKHDNEKLTLEKVAKMDTISNEKCFIAIYVIVVKLKIIQELDAEEMLL